MKKITTKYVVAFAIALGVTLGAQAQALNYQTLGGVPAGFAAGGWNYVPVSPNGDGHDSLIANYSVMGWNQAAQIDFGNAASQHGNWSANVDIENMLESAGGVTVTFNLIVDNLTPPYSLVNDGGNWCAFQLDANSASGGGGYIVGGSGAYPSGGVWYPAGDESLTTYAMSYTGTQLGWSAQANNWFQLIFISNSSGDDAFAFYIDDLEINPIPEPTTLALAGLGAVAALLIFRRRQ